MKPAIKSYVRHALIAVTPLLAVDNTNWRHYAFAVTLALAGPFIRALDPADQAFSVDNDR